MQRRSFLRLFGLPALAWLPKAQPSERPEYTDSDGNAGAVLLVALKDLDLTTGIVYGA